MTQSSQCARHGHSRCLPNLIAHTECYHCAVGYMTTRETDTRTLCLPLPSDSLVGDSDAATGPGLLSGGAQSSGEARAKIMNAAAEKSMFPNATVLREVQLAAACFASHKNLGCYLVPSRCVTCAAMLCREPWCWCSKGDSQVGHCPSSRGIAGSSCHSSCPGDRVLSCTIPQKSVPGTISVSALPFGFKLTEQALLTIPNPAFRGKVVCNMHPGLPQAADLQRRSMSCSPHLDARKAFLKMPMHPM